MRLHNSNTNKESYVLSSNDVLVTGDINNNLTDVINEQEEKINNLEQNVKWLYKYGGTGSKGGGGPYNPGTNLNLNASILFGTTVITDSGAQRVIISNKDAKFETLSIRLTDANVLNIYSVSIKHGGYYIKDPLTNKEKWSLNDDNDYSITVQVQLSDSRNIIIDLQGTSSIGTRLNKQYVFTYIKNPYVINLALVNDENREILNSGNLYTNNINNGVNLSINYNVASDKSIKYEISDGGAGMFILNEDENINEYEGIINDKNSGGVGVGSIKIPLNDNFIFNDNNYGSQNISVKFTIDPDPSLGILNAQTLYENISFTYIPADKKFFKIEPQNSNAKIYKYLGEESQSYQNATIIYNSYKRYFTILDQIEKDNALDGETKQILINELSLDSSVSLDQIKIALSTKLNELESSLYIFSLGSLSLYVQPFNGNDTLNSTDISYICSNENLSDEELSNLNSIEVSEAVQYRKRQLINIPIQSEGIYRLSIFSNSQDKQERIYYYFAVFNKNTSLNWFMSDVDFNKVDLYYRMGDIGSYTGFDTTYINQYKSKNIIQQYSNHSSFTLFNIFDFIDDANAFSNSDCDVMFSIGLQYSDINNVKKKILSLLVKENASSLKIDIYQNKITKYNNPDEILATWFIPKERNYSPNNNDNYHLLTFYKRYIFNDSASHSHAYEICMYLDGCLETAFKIFLSDSSVWHSVILEPGNYSINFFELAYFNHDESKNNKRFDLSGNDVTQNTISYLDDISIAEYWYKYASLFKTNKITNGEIPSFSKIEKLLNNLRQFKETDYGMIEVASFDDIKNIAKEVEVPILYFEYTDKSKNDFVNWFTTKYGESGNENQQIDSSQKHLDNLYYSPGVNNVGLQNISIPAVLGSGSYWYIKLQGSSTCNLFDKNLTLGLSTEEAQKIGIFTPNFYDIDGSLFLKAEPTTEESEKIKKAKSSFLPETAFTLKADVVDSSHSNNTAVGAFVNANTTPFDISFNDASKANNRYVNYIKNCLLGFPVLIFIKVTYGGNEKYEKYFFLGIYNFNLGRDSYFNMGYVSPSVLLNQSNINNSLLNADGNTFIVTYVSTTTESKSFAFEKGVCVAEIQGGSPYYDFSQYDDTILFPQPGEKEGVAMFGDFIPEYEAGTDGENEKKMSFHVKRLVKAITRAGGYIFDKMLKKHLGEYKYKYNRYIDFGPGSSIFNSANQVPNYKIQYTRYWQESNDDLKFLINNFVKNPDNSIKIDPITNQPELIDMNLSDASVFELIDTDSNPETAQSLIDARGTSPILDYKSTSEYYTACMAFGLVDSVMKNLNIKSWTAYYNEDLQEMQKTGKWFIAFYDMDTSFGRDNGGNKTSYFAFSDYWKTEKSTQLETPTIYRDFYPKKDEKEYVRNQSMAEAGYDVPSSYLFAIAKYAHLAYGNQVNSNTDIYPYIPHNIWARWRCTSNDAKLINTGGYGLGELRSADYFINKYFIRNLDNIPEQLWTMNYRFKYLKRVSITDDVNWSYVWKPITSNSGIFDDDNFKGFHGKGIYELQEWLAGRFHILDSYFNLEQYPGLRFTYLEYDHNKYKDNPDDPDEEEKLCPDFIPIIIYDELRGFKYKDEYTPRKDSNGNYIWNQLNYYEYSTPENPAVINANTDIEILRDIFSSGKGAKYGQLVNIKIRAKELSPFNITKANTMLGKYFIESSEQQYTVVVNNDGLQYIKFGGSTLWTDIENLNTLIDNTDNIPTLTLKTDKLDKIVLTSGTCSSYNIGDMRSLKTVNISKAANDTESNFSGLLTFAIDTSNNYDPYPDLTEISLIRTNITLKVQGEGVQKIDLSYTKSGDTIITGCNNLTSVNLNNFTAESLTLTPGWSNDMVINNSKIKSIKISPKDKEADERSITIKGDSELESIILDGFTNITLENCSNLYKICILTPNDVKSLNIINCNTKINVETNQAEHMLNICTSEDDLNNVLSADAQGEFILQFNSFNNIQSFKFTGTKGFTKVDVAESSGETIKINETKYNIIRLYSEAFANTDLNEIKLKEGTYLYIDSDTATGTTSTFANSGYGSLPNSMIIGSNVRKLDSMFRHDLGYNRVSPVIQRDFAQAFIEGTSYTVAGKTIHIIYENKDYIQGLNSVFYGQSKLQIVSNNQKISLGSFKNVNDISYMYYGTAVQIMTKEWWGSDDSYCGKNVIETGGEFKLDCFCSTVTQISIDIFDYYINNIKNLISNIDTLTYKFTIYNNNEEVKILDMFSKLNSSNILESFVGFNIDEKNHSIDWEGLFWDSINDTKRFPHLTRIYNSFNNGNKNSTNYNAIGIKNIINDLSVFENSLNFSIESNERYNISDLIDFDHINNNFKLPYINNNLSGAKQVNETEIVQILQVLSQNNCTNISKLFENTIIYLDNNKSDSDKNKLILSNDDVTTYTFKVCSHLFDGAKFIDQETNDLYGFEITGDTLSAFTKVEDWSYAFNNTTLHKNLPINMFNLMNENGNYKETYDAYNHPITNLSYMFNNVKIDSGITWFDFESEFGHKWTQSDYVNYNDGIELNGSYHNEIYTYYKPILSNPLTKDVRIEYDADNKPIYHYGENIVKNLILPWDIFYGCKSYANIENFISNSDFEGILPAKLFRGYAKELIINNTFANVLVIPNYVNKYLIKTRINGMTNSDIDINTERNSYFMLVPGYVFIPNNFTSSTGLSNAFTFKLLLPNSGYTSDFVEVDENIDGTNSNTYHTSVKIQNGVDPNICEVYFIFQGDSDNSSIKIGNINYMENMLPVNNIYSYMDDNDNLVQRALHIIDMTIIHNINLANNGNDIGFSPRKDYDIRLYMYLNKELLSEVTCDGTDNWVWPRLMSATEEGDKFIGLYNCISPTQTGLPLGGNTKLFKQQLFNNSILSFLYGALVNDKFNLTSLGIPDEKSKYIMQLNSEWDDFSHNIILPINYNGGQYYERALNISGQYQKHIHIGNTNNSEDSLLSYQACATNSLTGICFLDNDTIQNNDTRIF